MQKISPVRVVWPCLAPFSPIWPRLPRLALFDPVWPHFASFGPIWPSLPRLALLGQCLIRQGDNLILNFSTEYFSLHYVNNRYVEQKCFSCALWQIVQTLHILICQVLSYFMDEILLWFFSRQRLHHLQENAKKSTKQDTHLVSLQGGVATIVQGTIVQGDFCSRSKFKEAEAAHIVFFHKKHTCMAKSQ